MITLAGRSLWVRKLSVLAALVAVLVGAALVTTTGTIARAQARAGAASVTGWRFSAVDAVVKPPAQVRLHSGLALDLPSLPTLSDDQVAAIAAAPGVSEVVLERPFPAYVVTDAGAVIGDAVTRSWGHPWPTAVADGGVLTAGSAPRAADQVVVDRAVADAGGIEVGDRVQVQLASGLETFTVTGVVSRAGEQFEHALFFTEDVAVAHGGAPVLALVSTSDVAALADAVGDLMVITGEGRAGSLQLDLRQAELAGGSSQFLLVVAGLALLTAGLVISSTLLVAVGQRAREVAMLRVVGARPALIRRMVVWEAVLIGATGGALGAAAGIGLAVLARNFFVAQGLMARGTGVGIDPGAVAAGWGTAVLAALLAAVLPARRATRIAPLAALREADAPTPRPGRGRAVAGGILAGVAGLCLAGGWWLGGPVPTIRGALALLSLSTAFLLLIAAAVLLGPTLLHAVVTLGQRVLTRSFAGFVASRAIRADLRRAAGVSVPLTLLVAVSSVLMFQDSANYQARAEVYARQVTADLVVTGEFQLGVPLGAAAVVHQVPGVAAASASVASRLVIDTPPTGRASGTVTGVDPASVAHVLDHALLAGGWERLADRGIGVSQVVADDKGWRLGDLVTFRYPDGEPGTATVVAIYDDPMGSSDLVLPLAALTPHLREPFATAIYVATDPGADPETVRASVAAALAEVAPGAVVVDREAHLGQVAAQASGDNWIILLVVLVLGGYAGVSAVDVLIGSTVARRREFALLRLAGAHRRQVVLALTVEVAVVTLAAIGAGTVIAAVTMTGYGFLLTGTVWLPFHASAYGGVVAGALLAAAVGTLAPAHAALRVAPLDGVR